MPHLSATSTLMFILAPAVKLALSAIVAVTPAKSADGVALRWTAENPWKPGPYLPIVGNPTSSSAIDQETFRAAIVFALQNWQAATANGFAFDYWQGTNPTNFPRVLESSDGRSAIFFASQNPAIFGPGAPGNPLNADTAAYTKLWIDATNQIVEADMVLNDLAFTFVSRKSPPETWPDFLANGSKIALLEDTLMHEFGHVLGLDHSTNYESSMYTFAWFDQAVLSCDDVAGIKALYGPADTSLGAISGVLRDPNGVPLLGASVLAINANDTDWRATALTDSQGAYTIGQLPSGSYYLVAEPARSGAASFSPYYASLNHSVCWPNGVGLPHYFSRQVLTDATESFAVPVVINSGQRVTQGDWTMKCGEQGGLVAKAWASMSKDMAPGIWQTGPSVSLDSSRSAAIVDVLDPTFEGPKYYKMQDLDGELKLRALTYSLNSGIQVHLRLLDDNGNGVSAQVTTPLVPASPGHNFNNYDTELLAQNLPRGTYFIEATASAVPAAAMSQGAIARDTTPFLLLTMQNGPTVTSPSQSPSCAPDASLFGAYVLGTGQPHYRGEDVSPSEEGCAMAQPTNRSWSLVVLGLGLMSMRRRRARQRVFAVSSNPKDRLWPRVGAAR